MSQANMSKALEMKAPELNEMAPQNDLVPAEPGAGLWGLLKRIHRNEQGGVSIETILIVAAIALPILIFVIKFAWPKIKEYFMGNIDNLTNGADNAAQGQ